jgi:SH3-like domain-containing protein
MFWCLLSFLLADPIAKKVDYYAALGSCKVKLYKGPGASYPLLYILTQRHYPVKVIGEFDHWCRVQCPDGEKGWIRKCYLSTKYRRSIITAKECTMHSKPSAEGRVLARIHKDVFVRIKKQENDWSYVVVHGNIKGWIKSNNIW